MHNLLYNKNIEKNFMTINGEILHTIISVCCECKKVLGIETHKYPANKCDREVDISHGYCKKCFKEAMKKFDEEFDCEQEYA